MDFKLFLNHFDSLVNAPGGIKNLRTLILDLAMNGQLVPLMPSEGNSHEAVERLISLIPENVKKSSRYQRSIARPISLGGAQTPDGWTTTILENLVELRTGATPSRNKPQFFKGDIPWLLSGDVNNPEIFDCAGRISKVAMESSNCKMIPADSVLIALNGQGKTRATVSILRIPATCNQSLLALTPIDDSVITCEYLFWFLKSKYLLIRDITGQNDRRGLNMLFASALLIDVPPIRQQIRIVKQIEELMVVCDELEEQQSRKIKFSNSARLSAFNAISIANSVEDLNYAWQRIHNNWETFVDTPESVNSLKALILDLAMRGKLSSPIMQGLSAKDLVERSILKNGKKPIAEDSLSHVYDPYEIPSHWVWSSIGILSKTQTGATPKPLDTDGLDEQIHYVTAGDMLGLRASPNNFVSRNAAMRTGRIADVGAVLFVGIGATIGKCCLLEAKATFNQQIHSASPYFMNSEFLCYAVASGSFQLIAKQKTNATAIPILNKSRWESIPIPVPPLLEQEAIIEKVHTLFALCDELQSSLQNKEDCTKRMSRTFFQLSESNK